MENTSCANATVASDAEHGEMIGVGYFRIPAPQIEPLLDFYGKTFGMKQIGCILEHAVILNVGRTREEATANKNVRVILDNRLAPVDQNPVAFIVRNIGRVVKRAKDNRSEERRVGKEC